MPVTTEAVRLPPQLPPEELNQRSQQREMFAVVSECGEAPAFQQATASSHFGEFDLEHLAFRHQFCVS